MQRQGRDLIFGLTGADVRLLQYELDLLGFTVPDEEVSDNRFGQGTQSAVVKFQSRFDLNATGRVDGDTAKRINTVMRETVSAGEAAAHLSAALDAYLDQIAALAPGNADLKAKIVRITDALKALAVVLDELHRRDVPDDLLADLSKQLNTGRRRLKALAETIGGEAPRFSVSGKVTQRDGAAIIGAPVRVTAKGLTAAADTVLGTVKTDEKGAYRIDYREAGKTGADLVVTVLSSDGAEGVTRSPLIVNAAPTQVVDLVVENAAYPPASEFDQIAAHLAPMLGDARPDALNADSIAYLSAKSGISPVRIAEYLQARRLAETGAVPAPVYYGMFRANLPVNKAALTAQDDELLKQAVSVAAASNVIDPKIAGSPDALGRFVAALNSEMVEEILQQPELPNGNATLGVFLEIAGLDDDRKRSVVQHMQQHTGRGPRFWETLQKAAGLDEPALGSLQLTAQLGTLTINNAPLMTTLHKRLRRALADGEKAPLRALVGMTTDQWLALVREHKNAQGRVIVPETLAGLKDPETAYARTMSRMVEDLYPTPTLAARAAADNFQEMKVLGDFLTAHPGFEFRDGTLPGFLRKHKITLADETRQALETVGRLYELAPRFDRFDTVRPLLEAGVNSAYAVRTMGERRFVRTFGRTLGEAEARRLYARAAQRTAAITSLFARHAAAFNTTGLSVIPRPDVGPILEHLGGLQLPGVDVVDFPTWESLFGNIDFCRCEHCNSVFSPAAYLVALLKFLRDRGALPALFERRPDIGNIVLDCHNTNTTLPYVDLVNEVLENFIAAAPITHQTQGEAPELRVHPEHINAEAYQNLEADLVYPWTLPFSLWTEEARAYLAPLDVTRRDIMDLFNVTPASQRAMADWLPIATEALGLIPATRTILLDGAFRSVRWNGRTPAQLRTVQTLVDTARISFLELRQLLGTRFVNADGALSVDFTTGEGEDAQFVCDLSQARIEALTPGHLNRIERFIRLQRAVGWSIHELDAVLTALGGEINEPALTALAVVKQLHEALGTDLLIIASWVADMDTHDYLTEDDEMARSFYAALFLNRTVGGDEETAAFEPDALAAGSGIIGDHEAAILAALQIITAEELTLIIERRLPDDGLNLANLSEMHRIATLKRALHLTVEALLDLLDLSGLDPFAPGQLYDAVHLMTLVDTLNATGFSVAELRYLLSHHYEANSPFLPTDDQINIFLTQLRDGLQRIQTDFTAVPDPTGEITAQMLGIIVPPESLSQTVSLIYGIAGADELPDDPPLFLDAQLALFIPDAGARDTIVTRLLDESDAGYLQPELQQAERFAEVLTPLADHLRTVQSITLIQQMFSDFLDIELGASDRLLGGLIHSIADPAQSAGALFMDDAFVQGTALIDENAFPDQYAMIHRLHKAAMLIHRFDLPTEELEWVITEHAAVAWLDLNDLPVAPSDGASRFSQWLNMARAAVLRQELPSGEPTLFALLRQAEAGGDNAAFDAFLTAVIDRTRWNRADLDTLLEAGHFDLDDLNADWGGTATLSHLWRLHHCFGILLRLGVSAEMAWTWTQPQVSRETAAEVKQAARAKYSESQWLNTAEQIRDSLRQKQRTALVDAVIQQINDPEIQDTNALYGFFLMDAEMNPCMLTSRIVFATSAVQLFVQRCFLNLEADVGFSSEDAEMWAWMKNYRVWEANVKVFITPENWIEPELRPEKSPFFKDLEDELLQNDVTLETAELAYQHYLEKLDEVARLEVVGLFNENDTKTLHVIARTKGTPHKYFYRQWYEARRWTPWQEIPVDIAGETVTPVIYNRRLYIFWFMIQVKAEEEVPGGDDGQAPNRYLEIKLAWSQYRQRKWTPKRISEVTVETDPSRYTTTWIQPEAYRPRPIIQPNGDLLIAVERTRELTSSILDSTYLKSPGNFLFINDGQIETTFYGEAPDNESAVPITTVYTPVEESVSWRYYWEMPSAGARLRVQGYNQSWQDVLDKVPDPYRVTVPLQYTAFNSLGPFIFEDRHRTYFVTPRHIFGSAPSHVGDLTIDFPQVNVFLDDHIRLSVNDILSGIIPDEGDPTRFLPSLESTLYPETRTPVVDAAVSDTIAGIDRRVMGAPPLAVLTGGGKVVGGDVGIPLIGSGAVFKTGLGVDPGAPAMRTAVSAGAQSMTGGAVRSDAVVRSTTELYVANAVMTVGFANSLWGVWADIYRRSEYTFHPFYHPYVGFLIKQLNRYGVDGILNPREHGEAHDLRRQLMTEPSTAQFDDIYDLGEDINDSEDMLPVEAFDFEYGRAYNIYNWELFFHIPFMIANHLTLNQRFEEAQQWYHYIFDPTDNSDVPPEMNPYRFWKIKPFYENTDIQTIEQMMRLLSSGNPADLEMKRRLEDQIKEWRENPFQPHLIAEQRPVAYQKAIVMKYLDNLIAWGDHLFRRDTRESVFEAIQLYILAAEILGKRPEAIPAPDADRTIGGEVVRTFNDLEPHLDAFGNALVMLESEISSAPADDPEIWLPSDFAAPAAPAGPGNGFQGPGSLTAEPPVHEIVGSTLFFCIPPNEKLLGYWDTVADRLFKIRNCMNIEGVVRQLDLFAPPIDPALLVRAAAAGIDLGSVLNDLNAPKPHYRFAFMAGKALEFCNEVKALGNALLGALEKRDVEEMALLRQTHEMDLLEAVKQVRQRQVDEAKETLAGLEKNLESANARHQFYAKRNPLIPNEKLNLDKMESAALFDTISQGIALVGSALAAIPEFDLGAEGGFSSPVVKVQFGGANLSKIIEFASQITAFIAGLERHAAQRASTLAGYDRRQEEWGFSAAQAQIESQGLERQVAAAQIRIEITEHELANQEKQIEQSREIDEFMRYKFTNKELYNWMVTQISTIYFQCFQLAYDTAKRAEKAFQHELADYSASFINFGYWDSLKKGLLAGDRLSHDLRRMEAAYYERNKRELELTKHVSLSRLDPAALIQLRESGSCEFEIPEAVFNLDYPGHYLRRLKTVSLTIPGVVGPYTGVQAVLTLLSNRIRVSATDAHVPYAGVDDPHFITNTGGIQAIATSSGREDSGLFELNLRDERYLPFEGAGAVSRWRIELNADYPAFDHDTISDAILHLRYTARDGGQAVRAQVVPVLNDRINALVNATEHTGLYHYISLAREFSNELYQFLNPSEADDHATTLTIQRDHFPYIFIGRPLTIQRVVLLLKLRDDSLNSDIPPFALSLTRDNGGASTVSFAVADNAFGGLAHATHTDVSGELAQEEHWNLHAAPDAVAALPAELGQTVDVAGEDVPRLIGDAFEDVGVLINYTVG